MTAALNCLLGVYIRFESKDKILSKFILNYVLQCKKKKNLQIIGNAHKKLNSFFQEKGKNSLIDKFQYKNIICKSRKIIFTYNDRAPSYNPGFVL